jgi:hypothetical protein
MQARNRYKAIMERLWAYQLLQGQLLDSPTRSSWYTKGDRWYSKPQMLAIIQARSISALFTETFKRRVIRSPSSQKFGIRIYTYDTKTQRKVISNVLARNFK